MNKELGALLLAGTLVLGACQQTQEADDSPDTVVKEKETVVQPAPAPAPAPESAPGAQNP